MKAGRQGRTEVVSSLGHSAAVLATAYGDRVVAVTCEDATAFIYTVQQQEEEEEMSLMNMFMEQQQEVCQQQEICQQQQQQQGFSQHKTGWVSRQISQFWRGYLAIVMSNVADISTLTCVISQQ